MILKFLKKIWKDPVWSKIIAAGITASGFWLYKLPLWVYLVLPVGLIGVFVALRHQASKKPPLFKSTLAHPYEYQLEECKHWDPSTQQFYGEGGKGILSVQDGMITILRTNREGRVKVRIKKYLHGTNKMDYVKNDISGSAMRILHASLECRVIGGKHRLGVTVSRRDGSWITSNFLDVTSGEWEPLHTYLLDIPATEDFIIEFEDSQIERENSGIQLRNIKIEEIIH